MNRFRIGYFADGPWAHLAFNKLRELQGLDIGFVCLRNDNPDMTLAAMAKSCGIPVITHANVNSDQFRTQYLTEHVDMFVSMSFNQIFKKPFFSTPKLGTINCHAGKLPFYRGRNILNWVLINDEDEFGITVHHVDEGIDTGDIILQRTYPITDEDNYASLLKRSHAACAEILFDAVEMTISGVASRQRQTDIHPEGFYCTKRSEGDEVIRWDNSSRELFNFVRALASPGPRARTINRGSPMFIERLELIPNMPSYIGIPGAVLNKTEAGILVKTLDSAVLISEFSCDRAPRIGDRLA